MNIPMQTNYYEHPLFDPSQLHFETRQTQKLAETFNRWIWTGSIGGRVLGHTRTGKTTALEVVAKKLTNRAGVVLPSHIFYVPRRDKPTIASVYRNLCLSVNLHIGTNRASLNADILASDFTQYIIDTTLANGTNTFILMVDEMQRLTPNQLYAFSEMYDLLRLSRLNLVTFFIGNKLESKRLLEVVKQKEYSHINKRFFSQRFIFDGLRTKDDVNYCLTQYDISVFPPQSKTSYTHFFLPTEWNNGFQLSSLTDQIWTAFLRVKKQYSLNDWGMQYFVSAINTLLIDFLPNDGLGNFSIETILACIELSGLTSSLIDIEQ